MGIRQALVIAAAFTATAIVLGVPAAHADEAQDQQFLNLVHANGVPGQDGSLIAFAQEYCASNGPYNTVLPLFGQGVLPGQVYTIKVAASRAYCPDKIAVPVAPPQVYTGLGH